MMHKIAVCTLFAGVLAASAGAQTPAQAPRAYDAAAEKSYSGIVNSMIIATGPDGTVGIHVSLKTPSGLVNVEVGPAMFIGMNNFAIFKDDQLDVTGAFVSHDGDVALWARELVKDGKTLVLRSPDGTPRWPYATADDPDGCGVSHAVIR